MEKSTSTAKHNFVSLKIAQPNIMIKSFHNTLANGLLLGTLALATIMLNPITVDAQTIDVGPPDTSVCNGTPIDLIAITTGAGGAGSSTPVDVPTDDVHSQIIDIGFPFEFFGNIYTQCVTSSNGYITFDLTQANQFSPWGITAASPTPGVPDNAIMFPWQDINPGAGSGGTNAADCGDGVFVVAGRFCRNGEFDVERIGRHGHCLLVNRFAIL